MAEMKGPSYDTSTRPVVRCCQHVEIKFTCGHYDDKWVRYTTDNTIIRTEFNPSIKPSPETYFDPYGGGRTPLPIPTFNNSARQANPASSNPSPAATTTTHPNDNLVHDHRHPLCGLFHTTKHLSDTVCQSCYRRDMCVPDRQAVTALETQLRLAKRMRWSHESIEYLERQVKDAMRARDELGDLIEAVAHECWLDEGEG